MTRATEARHNYYSAADYTVHLLPGEGLMEARHRWETTTGRSGLIIIW